MAPGFPLRHSARQSRNPATPGLNRFARHLPMKTLCKILGATLFIFVALILYARFLHPFEHFPLGSVSAQRIEPGPWTVSVFEETFVDRRRPTPPNGEVPARPERVLAGSVWYPAEAQAGRGPLLVFSHGFTSLRHSGRYLAEHLAGYGFVVVAVDYPLTSMRAPGGPMLEDVVISSMRCIKSVATPKSAKRRSTQSPIRSLPTPPTACTFRPCLAATMAADPAAPDTARVNSSTKTVFPPGGISVTGRHSASKV